MSEYQYYEFRAIDEPLSKKQMEELRKLSTRAEITSTSFTNEYHFGDFRGNPRKMMEKYFDAFLYFANWGTHQLMLRLPRKLVDLKTLRQYASAESLSIHTTRTHVILEFQAGSEGADWDEVEASLASLIPLREQILGGDLRSLYLGWLGGVLEADEESEQEEPPLPPGMKRLSGALKSLADFLYLDRDLLALAVQPSTTEAVSGPGPGELKKWVKAISASQKEKLLLRVAEGEGRQVEREIRQGFLEDQRKNRPRLAKPAGKRRTVAELIAAWEKRTAKDSKKNHE